MFLRFLTSVLAFATFISGYPTGVDTCESAPQHGSWAPGCSPNTCMSAGGATTLLPFAINIVDSNNIPTRSYIANTSYNIRLQSTNGTSFKGFLFNVGRGNMNGNFATISAAYSGAGNLTISPSDINVRRMLQCSNGLTHVNNNNKDLARFTWLSPPAGTGVVTFKSVIVTSATSVNYVVSLRLNELTNISPTSTPTSCSIPFTVLTGVSGVTPSYVISTVGSTAVLGGVSPTCASGSGVSSGAKLAFMIDLGVDTVLGSQLTVDTCLTAVGDTVLYVGTGCASSSASFGCLTANDDMGAALCPSDSVASRISINVSSRYVWAVVGNYGSTTTASSGLRWWYGGTTPPSVSTITIVSTGTNIATATTATSASGTPRGSRTPTMSGSITRSSTASVSVGIQPSDTSTGTASMMPSVSSSVTQTPSDSQTFSDSSSHTVTQTPTMSVTGMESASKSMPPSPSRSVSSTESSSHTPIETDTPSVSISSTMTVSSVPTSSKTSVSTISQTSEGTLTTTPTSTIRYIVMPINPQADVSSGPNYGMIGFGVGFGVIASFIIIGAYYVAHKNNKKTQKPLSMRNIIYMGDQGKYASENPMSSRSLPSIVEEPEPTTLSPTAFRYTKNIMDISNKQIFEPVTVRDETV